MTLRIEEPKNRFEVFGDARPNLKIDGRERIAQAERFNKNSVEGSVQIQIRIAPQVWASQMKAVRSQVVDAYTSPMTAVSDIMKYQALGGLVESLSYNGQTFHLAEPLSLSVRHEDSWWMHEHDELKIFAHGTTIAESLAQFALQFDAAWTYIAQADDEQLTEDAQELKQLLLSLVARIEAD